MASMLEHALREVGTIEDPPGSNRTRYAKEAGHLNGQPWCASFVVAVARRAGVKLPSESAYTPTMALAFKKAGLWSTTPHVGAVVFFDFPDSKHRIQHVGIVESFDKRTVTSIEGNTSPGRWGSQDNGGGVYRRTRPIAHAVGFGRVSQQEDTVTPVEIKAVAKEVVRLLLADDALGPVKHHIAGSADDGARLPRVLRDLDAVKEAHGITD